MNRGRGARVTPQVETVGLVQDAKYSEVKRTIPPQFFLPYRQDDGLAKGQEEVSFDLTRTLSFRSPSGFAKIGGDECRAATDERCTPRRERAPNKTLPSRIRHKGTDRLWLRSRCSC